LFANILFLYVGPVNADIIQQRVINNRNLSHNHSNQNM